MKTASYRCVVTGHSSTGRSCVTEDNTVSVADVLGMADFWRTAEPSPGLSADSEARDQKRLLPAPGGTVFRFFEIPPAAPETSAAEHLANARAQFAAAGATECQVDTTRHPMMHRTDTIDYVVLLRGEVTLILDDGEVDVRPFDAVVQRGANHYWVNRGTAPALFAAVLLDARR
jgi:hypothetical protein